MPQEVEVWYIIPSIRREFAIIMSKKGMPQKFIAEKLGITEAAVSQYIKNKRAHKIKFNQKTKKEIVVSVNRMLKNSHVITETQHICNLLKQTLSICQFHHIYDHDLPKDCKLCMVK